jgi:hypothetical protein
MAGLDVADLVVIAGQTLGTGTDVALERIDIAAAHAALDSPCGAITDRDTAAAAGIGLIHSLLRHRPFPRDGAQIAVAAGLQFLSLNGWRADLDPPAAAAVVVEALASGQLSPVSAAAWLSPRLFPHPVAEARTRLAPLRNVRPGGLRPGSQPPREPPPAVRRRSRPAGRTPARRALVTVMLAVALSGLALLATACSRGPASPAPAPAPTYTTCVQSSHC